VIEPVLNELSLEPAPMSTLERVASLLGVLKKLDALGFPRLIRQTRDALLREIEDGLSFRAWLFQKAPPDLRRFLAGRLEKAPYVEQLHQDQEEARRSQLQAFCGEHEAIGAGIVYFYDTLPLRCAEILDGTPIHSSCASSASTMRPGRSSRCPWRSSMSVDPSRSTRVKSRSANAFS